MLKRSLFLGIVSGALASVASLVYQKVYAASLGADFSTMLKPVGIVAACLLGGLIGAVGYWLLTKWLKGKGEVVFNFLFVLLSFASIVSAFAVKLPLDFEAPELFPGLVVPMHFFPALAWFTLKPIFIKPVVHFGKLF